MPTYKVKDGGEIIIDLDAAKRRKNKQPGKMIKSPRRLDYLPRRIKKGLGIRIFDLAYRKVGDSYETQYFNTPVLGVSTSPFPANTYIDNVITPLLASLPATPMRDHFYQIPKRLMSMRTDTHWPYYGLIAQRSPEPDCNLSNFPNVSDEGVIPLAVDGGNTYGELNIGSIWWVFLPEWPFGTQQPPGWNNTLITGYGLDVILNNILTTAGIYAPHGKITALPDYSAPSVVIPDINSARELDIFFPPWLHSHQTGIHVADLKIVPREEWLDETTIPSADLLGGLPFNTLLICIVEGWNGQRFYIWSSDGVGM
jgi:hypothetical protein